MCLITGRIEEIKTEPSSQGLTKEEVTIVSNDNQKWFIEFRSPQLIKILKSFAVDDQVIVAVKGDGKTSKLGKNFNNIVAASIQKV